MKTFKDLQAFKKRIEKTTAWEDYFMLGGKMFTIYEYGGGSMFGEINDYVYFLNKRSKDMIKVIYRLPNTQYKDGKKVVEGQYTFIDLEYTPNYQYLWR